MDGVQNKKKTIQNGVYGSVGQNEIRNAQC